MKLFSMQFFLTNILEFFLEVLNWQKPAPRGDEVKRYAGKHDYLPAYMAPPARFGRSETALTTYCFAGVLGGSLGSLSHTGGGC